MINDITLFSIIVRMIAEVIFITIFVQQVKVFNRKSPYNRLQVLLLVALGMLLLSNTVVLGINFYRDEAGVLTDTARTIGSVASALASLGAASALYLINKFKLK